MRGTSPRSDVEERLMPHLRSLVLVNVSAESSFSNEGGDGLISFRPPAREGQELDSGPDVERDVEPGVEHRDPYPEANP